MAEAISQHGTPMGRMQKRIAAPWVTLKIFGQWDELLAIESLPHSTPYLDGILSYVKGSAHIAKGCSTAQSKSSVTFSASHNRLMYQ